MGMVYRVKKRFEMEWMDKFSRKMTVNKMKRGLKKRTREFKRYKFDVEGLVLDAGTGVGSDLLAMFSLSNKLEAVGVDISRQALKFAKKVLPRNVSHLICADIRYLPFKRDVFDAVNIRNVLHHHPFNILKQIMLNLTEVVKGDGTFLIKEPCEASEKNALREEIEDLRYGIDNYKELMKMAKSSRLREQLINILPIFRYGMTYQSLLNKIVLESGLKIEVFDVIRENSDKSKMEQLLKEIEEKIEKSAFTSDEKAYLLEKLSALNEKIKLIKPVGYKSLSVVIKAKKQADTPTNQARRIRT